MSDPSSSANGADHGLRGDPPIADITARPAPGAAGAANDGALSAALGQALREARVMFDSRARVLTDQARDTFATVRAQAEKRRAQGVEMVRARPYAAVAAAALAGFLIGHLTSASRTHLVVLRDER